MGSIICQSCNQVIDYYESEKVSVLYGVCCEKECDDIDSKEAMDL